MPNKKINQLATRIPATTDLLLIGDPITGISYKGLVSDIGLSYVPYTGATTNVNLGEHQILAGQVTFDQTPTNASGVGVLRWNNQDGTLDLGLLGGNVTLQIGQEEVQRVVNKSGILLTEAAYQVVKVTDAQGQRLAVDLAQGNNDANSTDTLGIVTENISNNQEGYITTSGLVRNINTTGSLQSETWLDGDVLYLSPFTAGAITNIKPTAPSHTVILGYVVHAHPTQGKIFVKCDNGYELGELHNCYLPSPSNNDGIFWNTVNQRYQNSSINSIIGYIPQQELTLTTTGTSGAATLIGATLNIPQYSGGGGASTYSVSIKTSTYTETALSGEIILLANSTTSTFTINLATAIGNTSKVTIKKIASINQIIIDGNGSQTIDGGLTATLNKLYESITLISDNSNWQII